MRKCLLISYLLLILMVSAFIGCSDDNETIIAAAAQGYLIGYVNYSHNFKFYADIMPMTNSDFTIDSIVANDSIAEYSNDGYWYVYGDNNYQWAELYSDSTNYVSGDTVEVKFYNNNTMATLNIRLIDNEITPNYILPVINDTVAFNQPINIIWNNDQDADWYGLYVQYYRDSAGSYTNDFLTYSITKDTTFIIPASENIYDGYYRIYLMAVNGPTVDDPLNLNGAGLIGEFHSFTASTFRQVYVGTGDPTPVSNNPEEPEIDSKQASKLMMDYFTKHELKVDNH